MHLHVEGAPTVPSTTLLEIPPAEQGQMCAVLRRTRYGYLLAFHLLLWCAAGRNPTDIAVFLLCSRSSVYRLVRAYRAGSLGIRIDPDGQLSIAVQSTLFGSKLSCCGTISAIRAGPPGARLTAGGSVRWSFPPRHSQLCSRNTAERPTPTQPVSTGSRTNC